MLTVKPPRPAKKAFITTMRMTPDNRQNLEEAAALNGRSLSDEITRRLVQSFKTDPAGGPANAAFLDLLGAHIREIENTTGEPWRSDTVTWMQVRDAILREIDFRRPASSDPSAEI